MRRYSPPLLRSTPRGVAVCLIAASLGGAVSFLATRQPVRAAGSPSALPFSAVIVESYFSPEGKLGRKDSEEYYRFSDGSFAIVNSRQVYPEEKQLIGNVVDLQLQHDLILEPVTKSVVTLNRNREQQLSFLAGLWNENCPDADDHVEATENGGMLLGFPTVHITKHLSPEWKQDRWMITKLKCFSVKDVDVFGDSRDETLVTSLVEGEPSRSVLSAPGDYTERPPADAAKAYALASGGDQLFHPRLLDRLTKEYKVGR